MSRADNTPKGNPPTLQRLLEELPVKEVTYREIGGETIKYIPHKDGTVDIVFVDRIKNASGTG